MTEADPPFYPYHVEPIRPALILIGFVLLTALLAPNPNVRILVLVLLSGPVVWAALQVARRRRGVYIEFERSQLVLQSGLLRRALVVPLGRVQAVRILPRGQLAVAYLQPRKADAGEEPRPPRLRLYVTAALDSPEALLEILPPASRLSPAQLSTILVWRRIRRFIFGIFGLFLGVPLLMIIMLRVMMAVFGLSVTR